MAIFHASTKSISRSAGRSAVAAIAYRTACRLVDERTGQVHDYTRKGGVVSTEILLPDGSSAERNALWNAAEAAEKRKDARTAREWVIALPSELDAQQRQELAVGFGIELATRYGVAVDLAIHKPDSEGDNRNHHAHILTTTRQVSRDESGALVLGKKALIELSDRDRRAQGLGAIGEEIKAVRQLWERTANQALRQAGRDERIDSRTLQAQGIDREATRHLGPAASEMERRGIQTDRGDMNRQAAANNQERAQLVAQVIDLQAQRERQEAARKAARREADAARRQKAKDEQEQARHARFEEMAREFEEAVKPWQRLQQTAPQKPAQQAAPPPPAPARAQKLQQAPPTPAPAQALRQSRPSEPAPAPAAPRQPSPDELQSQREQAERERIERLSIDELRREIERLRPQHVALAVLEDEAVKAAREAQQALENQIHRSHQLERWARETARMWRQANPMKARAHDAGLFRSGFLAEREGAETDARQKRLEAETKLPDAKLKAENLRTETEKRFMVEQAPIRARMAKLQKVLDVKEERAQVVSEFQRLAANRAGQRYGWDDQGEEWQATPALLRNRIDTYNQASPDLQASALQRMGTDPQASQMFKELLEQRQELVQQWQQNQGWSHGR